jgi:Prohead core protein serine protease
MLLESSPIPFRPEIIAKAEELTEEVQISGSSDATKPLMKVRGLFQRYDEKNANGRIYPKELFDRCLNEESWKQRLQDNSVIGLVEHPEDGITKLTGPISHVVTKAWDNKDGTVWGECLVLNTPDGQKMGALFEAGVPVGISSRGEGEVEAMDEATQRVIPDSFNLITWDFVADNSVPGARVIPVKAEAKARDKSTTSTVRVTSEPSSPKVIDKEYLRAAPDKLPMNKIGEMRKVDVELKKLKELASRKLTFQARVGLSEEIALLRSKASAYMREDGAVEAYGKKLLTEMDDFSDDVEGDDMGDSAPPPDAGAEAPPPPGGEGEAGDRMVDKQAFDTVMKAVLTSLAPEAGGEGGEMGGGPEGGFPGAGAPGEEGGDMGAGAGGGGEMQSIIDQAYNSFNETGSIDVNALVSQLQGGGEEGGEDSFNPDEPMGDEGAAPVGAGAGAPGAPPDMGSEAKFESRELRAAVKLIARLRESAAGGEKFRAKVDELAERLKAHHPYLKELEEARPKLKVANENAARLERNRALLGRAKTEIDRLKESLDEEKQVAEALTRLLKEHGIKDASKLAEETRAEATKKISRASTTIEIEDALKEDATVIGGTKGSKGSGAGVVGPGDCEVVKDGSGKTTGGGPGETLDDGKGENATRVDGEDQKGREGDEGDGKCNVVGKGDSHYSVSSSKGESKTKNGAKAAVIEEGKKEEEHDLLRYIRRQRSNPYDQL